MIRRLTKKPPERPFWRDVREWPVRCAVFCRRSAVSIYQTYLCSHHFRIHPSRPERALPFPLSLLLQLPLSYSVDYFFIFISSRKIDPMRIIGIAMIKSTVPTRSKTWSCEITPWITTQMRPTNNDEMPPKIPSEARIEHTNDVNTASRTFLRKFWAERCELS